LSSNLHQLAFQYYFKTNMALSSFVYEPEAPKSSPQNNIVEEYEKLILVKNFVGQSFFGYTNFNFRSTSDMLSRVYKLNTCSGFGYDKNVLVICTHFMQRRDKCSFKLHLLPPFLDSCIYTLLCSYTGTFKWWGKADK